MYSHAAHPLNPHCLKLINLKALSTGLLKLNKLFRIRKPAWHYCIRRFEFVRATTHIRLSSGSCQPAKHKKVAFSIRRELTEEFTYQQLKCCEMHCQLLLFSTVPSLLGKKRLCCALRRLISSKCPQRFQYNSNTPLAPTT